MNVAPPRPRFSLERRTWVAVLAIGVGFGVVGSLGLAAAGAAGRGATCLVIPIVFCYTAFALERPSSFFRPPVAIAANYAVTILAAALALEAFIPVLTSGITAAHPVVLTLTTMSALIQAAVVLVCAESIHRLAGEMRRSTMGD